MKGNKYNKYSLIGLINHQMAAIAMRLRRVPRRKNKSILLFCFLVFCTINFLLTPHKAEAIVFSDIAEWGRNAATKVAENQEKIVQRYFGEYNPLGNITKNNLCLRAEYWKVS